MDVGNTKFSSVQADPASLRSMSWRSRWPIRASTVTAGRSRVRTDRGVLGSPMHRPARRNSACRIGQRPGVQVQTVPRQPQQFAGAQTAGHLDDVGGGVAIAAGAVG